MGYQWPLKAAELKAADGVEFLFEFNFAGREFRWATTPLNIVKDDGTYVSFQGGLEVDFDNAFDLFSESPNLISQPITVIFDIDVAEMVAKGHTLFNQRGSMSIWVDGRTYEQRLVLLRGRVADPEYGAKGEPVSFSLMANDFEDTALIPDIDQRVSLRTWSNYDEGAQGLYYPIVFGTPGVYKTGTGASAEAAGSPAYGVDLTSATTPTILVAGHEVQAGTVNLINATQGRSADMTITKATDALGNTVTTGAYPYSGMSSNAFVEGDELFCCWNATDGGGLLNRTRSDALKGAGEIAIHFLELASIDLDLGRWYSIEDYLNQHFQLSGYIDEEVSPLSWLNDNVFGLLPVSMMASPEGLAPCLWRRDVTAADALANLTAGPSCQRSDAVVYEFQELENEVRFDFALAAWSGDFQRTMTAVGIGRADTRTELSTEYTRASHNIWGKHAVSISSDIVYEDATAAEILLWRTRAKALPYRVINYFISREHAFLKAGDVITITDTELHLTDQVALVRSVIWQENQPLLQIVLVEDPPRDKRKQG